MKEDKKTCLKIFPAQIEPVASMITEKSCLVFASNGWIEMNFFFKCFSFVVF